MNGLDMIPLLKRYGTVVEPSEHDTEDTVLIADKDAATDPEIISSPVKIGQCSMAIRWTYNIALSSLVVTHPSTNRARQEVQRRHCFATTS